MDRAQKAESIETLKGVFADAGAVVVTHNLGLTVAEMEDLRGRLRKEGGAFKVVKNRLALKALETAFAANDAGLVMMRHDPMLAPLHKEPRFRNLLRRMGFAAIG